MTKKTATTTQKTTKETTKTEVSMIADNTVLELTIPADVAGPAYEHALARLAKALKADGFRKGKVPAHLAESMVGAEKIINEALQAVVPQAYQDLITASGKKPLTYPEFSPISLEKGQDWKLKVYIAEKPEITLGDYKKVVASAKKEAEKHQKELDKEKKAAKDDENSKESHEGHDHNHDEREHTLQHIYGDLIKDIKPQIPELLVKEEVRGELDMLVRRLQGIKLDLDTFLKQRNMSFEQLSQELTYQVLGRLQLSFILDAIIEDQKIVVENSELNAIIEKTEDAELKKRQQTDERYKQMLYDTLLRQKLTEFLLK